MSDKKADKEKIKAQKRKQKKADARRAKQEEATYLRRMTALFTRMREDTINPTEEDKLNEYLRMGDSAMNEKAAAGLGPLNLEIKTDFFLNALLVRFGFGVVQDKDRAMMLMKEGMKKFPRDPRFPLYLAEDLSRGGSGKVTEAEHLVRKAIDIDPKCQRAYGLLATFYDRKQGDCKKDLVEAKRLYELAPDQEVSMFNLGLLLEKGAAGVEKDLPRAARLFLKTVITGDLEAPRRLSAIRKLDPSAVYPNDLWHPRIAKFAPNIVKDAILAFALVNQRKGNPLTENILLRICKYTSCLPRQFSPTRQELLLASFERRLWLTEKQLLATRRELVQLRADQVSTSETLVGFFTTLLAKLK